MARSFGRDHEDINVGRRLDELEMDVEAVAEGQVLALGQIRRYFGLINFRAHLVGHQHHNDVGALGCVGCVEHRQTLLGGFFARR